MFFNTIDEHDVDIAYLCEYLSKKKFDVGGQDCRDNRSTNFVLKFKDGNSHAIKKVFDELYPQLGDDFAIAVVPSSNASNNFNAACHELCRLIVEQAQKDGKNITDASKCLKREYTVSKKHIQSGPRTMDDDLKSISVLEPELIKDKDVLVLDDVYTSGLSIKAAKILLQKAGAKDVKGFAVGKTVGLGATENVLRYGFIFDLDQTLFNTDHIKGCRDSGKWKIARDLAYKTPTDPNIKKLISYIKTKLHGEICIVTTSKRAYAKLFAHKLGIDSRHVVAYSDCAKHKPDPQQYFRAKQIMGIHEGCTIVIGDSDTDLKPAQELGMTSVQAQWYSEESTISKYADFHYDSVSSLLLDINNILQKADNLREKVSSSHSSEEYSSIKEAQLFCQVKESYVNNKHERPSSEEDLTTKEFKTKYDIHLNNQQEKAFTAIEGANLLLAVPGSGKTTVLIARIGYMILVKHINPANILAITFNKQASLDMTARFTQKFGEELGSKVKFQTIHSLARGIYIRFCEKYGHPKRDVLDSKDSYWILRRIYLNNHEEKFVSNTELTDMENVFSYIKNMMIEKEDIEKIDDEDNQWSAMYQEYQDTLKIQNRMDFDDMLVNAKWILEHDQTILEEYRSRYQYISVDEAQDNSKIQNALIKLLAQGKSIFMVGDEDQSIYGFRGAYPKALLDFEKDYPNANILLMETNYRSTPSIVDTAQYFISKNTDRHEKHMVAAREPQTSVSVSTIKNRSGQFTQAFETINEHLMNREKGNPTLNTFAFLYRDNSSAVPIVDYCLKHNIELSMKKPERNFFTTKVVRDIKAYLKLSLNPYDIASFEQINATNIIWAKNHQKQFVRDNCSRAEHITVVKALELCNDINMNHLRDLKDLLYKIRDLNPKSAIYEIYFAGYQDYLKKRKLGSDSIDILALLANDSTTIKDYLKHLKELEEKMMQGFDSTSDSAIKLSTIHSSKGLEYDAVSILDVFNGKFPAARPHPFSVLEGNADTMQEERRLFYVGITRAKSLLMLYRISDRETDFVDEILSFPHAKK